MSDVNSNKMVITCAVCGAETTRKDNPALPLTPEEIAQATYEAYDKGAAIVHLHVRDEAGLPTMSPEIFKKTITLIREQCEIVIETTTGGAVGMSHQERMQVLELAPEMASLDCGTVNFGEEYIVNPLPAMRQYAQKMAQFGVRPTLECFDLSHIYAARVLIEEGLVSPPYHFGLVMNVPGGVKYEIETLDFFVRRLPPNSYWTVMGIGGRASLYSHYGAVSMNGFIRVGFEDNVYLNRGVLARSNAELVDRAAQIAVGAGYEIAKPKDVREMFQLKE